MEDSFEGIYLNNYKFEKYIRGDSHCAVFKGVHLKTARKVAIKSFFLKEIHPKFKDFLQNDLDRYRSITNPNVLKIEEYFESEVHGFLVYEYCKDRTLEDFWIKHKKLINERKLIKIVRQIFNGFKALIEKQIYNRDYKIRNILISENKVKVGDCLDFVKTGSVLFHNQREYLAPEVLEAGDEKKDPVKADLWAIGVAIYKMTYGKVPFQGINDLLLLKDIRKCLEDEEKWPEFKRDGLKNWPLFAGLLRSIFKPLKERHLANVFKEELLTKKFEEKDFEEMGDDVFSLASNTEKTEVSSPSSIGLNAQSAPNKKCGVATSNLSKSNEGIPKLNKITIAKTSSYNKNEICTTADEESRKSKKQKEIVEDEKECSGYSYSHNSLSKDGRNYQSTKKNKKNEKLDQNEKNIFPGCNALCRSSNN